MRKSASGAKTSCLEFDSQHHRYWLEGELLPSVTQILEGVGMIDTRFYTEEARLLGSAVHQATQYLDEGDLDEDSVDPQMRGHLAAYQLFKKETGFSPVEIEVQVYHPEYRYAGTFDRLGVIVQGRQVLVDLKTGPVQPWVGLQLAGYALCIRTGGFPQRWGVYLREDGRYFITEFTDRKDKDVFLSAVSVFQWIRRHRGDIA
jgi:hypothetical protein